jgi:hypothetical protein
MLLLNVSENLHDGGFFFGTIPDAYKIVYESCLLMTDAIVGRS